MLYQLACKFEAIEIALNPKPSSIGFNSVERARVSINKIRTNPSQNRNRYFDTTGRNSTYNNKDFRNENFNHSYNK